VKRNLLCIIALLMFGTAGAAADELPNRPSFYILGPTSTLPWTGLYLGINGGYGWAHSGITALADDPAAAAGTCGGVGHGTCISPGGFLEYGGTFGGQIGYDWQINPLWLTGIETDYQWADFRSGTALPFHLGEVGGTSMLVNEAVQSFGTLRIRMGVIPINSLLLYGTGGFAYGHVNTNFSVPNPNIASATSLSRGGFSYSCTDGGPACFAGSSSDMEVGWTIGGGGEVRLTNNLTFMTEVLYVQLGAPSGTAIAESPLPGTAASSFTDSFSSVRLIVARGGFNYRF
jgi:outer membrane immunogenic protein